MNTLSKTLLLVLASLGIAATSRADAVLDVWTINGIVTITDNEIGVDSNSNIGAINWNGTVDGWNITVAAGLTVFGGSNPAVDLTALVTNTGSGAGTLNLFYGDNNFGPTSNGYLNGQIGGTTNAANTSILFVGGYNDSNISSGGSGPAFTTVTGSPFSATIGSAIPDASLYALMTQVQVTGVANSTTSFDAYVNVPDEASTALMIGLGLLGVGVASRRRKAS